MKKIWLMVAASVLIQGASPLWADGDGVPAQGEENQTVLEDADPAVEMPEELAKEGPKGEEEAPAEVGVEEAPAEAGFEGEALSPEGGELALEPNAEFEPEPIQANLVHARLGLGMTRVGKQAVAGTEFSAVFRYESDNFAFEFSPFEMLIDFSGKTEALRWGIFHFNGLYMMDPTENLSLYGGAGVGLSIHWVDGAEQDYSNGGLEFRLIVGVDYNRQKATRWNAQLELLLPTYSMDRSGWNDDPEAVYAPMLLLRTGVSIKTEIGIGQRIQNTLRFWFGD